MMREYPGLFAKGFRSTGQFGLGFFSVFMWASTVSVATRRCRDGHDQTRILEFPEGLDARPLLRMAKDHEQRSEPGTAVLLKLKAAPMSEEGFLRQMRWYGKERRLTDLCEWLFPAIDANLVCKSDGKSSKLIKALDWIRLNGTKLACRIFADERPRSGGIKNIYDKYSSGLRPLINADGNVVGRAVMCGHMFVRKTDGPGVVTTNGIRVESIHGLLGILEGVAANAPRDSATPLVDGETLAKWATKQAEIAPTFLRSAEEKHEVASMVAYCGGDTLSLPIARKSGRWISADQIRKRKMPNELFIIDAKEHDDERREPLKVDSNVFSVSNGYYYWGLRERRGGRPAWPPVPERFVGYSLKGENYSPLWFALVEAIADSWNESFDAVMSASSIRTENAGERVRIGTRGQ